MKERLMHLGPHPRSIANATSWADITRDIGKQLDLDAMYRQHGHMLVRQLRKQGKLKGLYREMFPQAAAYYDHKFGLIPACTVQQVPPTGHDRAASVWSQWQQVWQANHQHWPHTYFQYTPHCVSWARADRSRSPIVSGLMTCGVRGCSQSRSGNADSVVEGQWCEAAPRYRDPPTEWIGNAPHLRRSTSEPVLCTSTRTEGSP